MTYRFARQRSPTSGREKRVPRLNACHGIATSTVYPASGSESSKRPIGETATLARLSQSTRPNGFGSRRGDGVAGDEGGGNGEGLADQLHDWLSKTLAGERGGVNRGWGSFTAENYSQKSLNY